MVHRLNVSPSFPSIRQKKWVFAQERDQAIVEEVCKLQEAGFIREVYYWLAGECGDGQESQREMENMCGLHKSKQSMPQR